MEWEKLGRIFEANNQFSWMKTHAMFPTPVFLEDNIFRVFFGARDENNVSRIGFVDIDLEKPQEIINISEKPVLSNSKIGLFDDCGVTPCCALKLGKTVQLFYNGWSLARKIPFLTFVGVCKLSDKLDKGKRLSGAPIIDRCSTEPFAVGNIFITRRDSEKFQMWYESCLGWSKNWKKKSIFPKFSINYAESASGLVWERNKICCLSPSEKTPVFSRPTVIWEGNEYKMWYSFKERNKYHIGFAESSDGRNWIRKDDRVGIKTSPGEWDGEEIEYPYVFDHNHRRYMLYNGNGYGKTGFGLAVLRKE